MQREEHIEFKHQKKKKGPTYFYEGSCMQTQTLPLLAHSLCSSSWQSHSVISTTQAGCPALTKLSFKKKKKKKKQHSLSKKEWIFNVLHFSLAAKQQTRKRLLNR